MAILFPREVCGISFFYVVETDSPYYSVDKEQARRDDLEKWLDIDAGDLMAELEHDWPYKSHTIQITVRAVFGIDDLGETNKLLKSIITKSGYVISEPIGDANGNS